VVDLAKIRKKAKKKGTAGVPPADAQASRLRSGGEDAAASAAETAAVHEEASTTGNEQRAANTKLDRFKEQAGSRRDLAVTKIAERELQLELLTFTIAGEQYAIEIEKIVEIVTPRPITRIPNADPTVVGIISLRGTVVTLVDVRRMLRHSAPLQGGADTRIVVIDLGNEIVGFVVDRVLRVVKIAPNEVEPHPVVHTTELEESIRGVFRASGALTILLDLDKLLDHSQWT
jgi:purine-binding chemotaxis protein CheW